MKVKKILKTVATWVIMGAIAIAQFVPWIMIGTLAVENEELQKKVNK